MIAADPNDAESHYQLGQILGKLDRSEDALRHYEQAVAIDPSRADYHVKLGGLALAVLDQWNRALGEYQAAAERSPAEFSIYYTLGRALHENGYDEREVEAYQIAIDLNPSDPSSHLSLGVSCEGLHRWNDAVMAYR